MGRYKYIDEDKQHLHTLDDKPLIGTSTALKVLAKPLTWWASGLACEKFGWLNSKIHTKEERLENAGKYLKAIASMRDTEAYLKLLDEAYKAHSVKLSSSADKGIDLHEILENWIKWRMGIKKGSPSSDEMERILSFTDWSENNVEKFIASEVHCYSERLFVGGICDCVAKLKNGNLAIIDFKSSKDAYDSQFIQVAGYALQLEENGMWDRGGTINKKLDGQIVELVVFPFGAKEITAHTRFNVEQFKDGFRSAVALYKLLEIKN